MATTSGRQNPFPRPSPGRVVGKVDTWAIDGLPPVADDEALGGGSQQTLDDIRHFYRSMGLLQEGTNKFTPAMRQLVRASADDRIEMLIELAQPLYGELWAMPSNSSSAELWEYFAKHSTSAGLASRANNFFLSYSRLLGISLPKNWKLMPREDRKPSKKKPKAAPKSTPKQSTPNATEPTHTAETAEPPITENRAQAPRNEKHAGGDRGAKSETPSGLTFELALQALEPLLSEPAHRELAAAMARSRNTQSRDEVSTGALRRLMEVYAGTH